ncbi:MAG: thioredoxin family protein [Gemmatimonadetes bacterium]|nr:thioredoxin family protein [Gemmatimonadota bacterium]
MYSTRDSYGRAVPFAAMAAASAEYGALLTAQRARAVVPDDLLARVTALGGSWRLLVISEDWCIDSQSIAPVVAALADAAPNLELRTISRDADPALMDAHLTNGTARAIPVVVVLDADYVEHGWWGSRPRALQARVAAEWKQLEKPERNKEVRRWYAMDKGRSALEEIVALLEQFAASTAGAAAVQSASATAGA